MSTDLDYAPDTSPSLTITKGKTKDGEDVSGTITVPEVAHDTDEDDYVVSTFLLSAHHL